MRTPSEGQFKDGCPQEKETSGGGKTDTGCMLKHAMQHDPTCT